MISEAIPVKGTDLPIHEFVLFNLAAALVLVMKIKRESAQWRPRLDLSAVE